MLAAVIEAKGDGLARYFEHAFKDTLASAIDVKDDAEEVESPDSTAHYVGLLVGGQRRAAWAADPNKGPAKQLGGADASLLELATVNHAAKVSEIKSEFVLSSSLTDSLLSVQCVRMLCEGNFKAVRELIEARRKHVSDLIAKGSKDEEALKLWQKELRLLNAPDLANSEHVTIAVGAYSSPDANPLARALVGGRDNNYKAKDAAQVARADKRAIETVDVLLELVPQSIEWLNSPYGCRGGCEGRCDASAFIRAPSPAIVDWLLSHGADATARGVNG